MITIWHFIPTTLQTNFEYLNACESLPLFCYQKISNTFLSFLRTCYFFKWIFNVFYQCIYIIAMCSMLYAYMLPCISFALWSLMIRWTRTLFPKLGKFPSFKKILSPWCYRYPNFAIYCSVSYAFWKKWSRFVLVSYLGKFCPLAYIMSFADLIICSILY